MNQAFVRCPHCGLPHEHSLTVCPSTRLSIPRARPATQGRVQGAIPPIPGVPRPGISVVAPKPAERGIMVGKVIGEKYGVTGLIGEGGMGAVYEAEHLAIGRLVAVKVLHPKNAQNRDAVSRMHHEARVVGTIGHPNICEIYDLGRLDDGSPYLVMERLHGETLAERLLRGGPMPYVDLVDVMVQVMSALVVAHEKGIIHRDLKPDNIFLSQRAGMPPSAKLLDFGISKASNVEDAGANITRTGMVMGTPYYMAPEQARGDRTLDHRVDLWAAGIILYEAVSGRRPFVARNYNALLVQILTSRHRPVAEYVTGLPPALIAIMDRALSKMREDRFQSATEFLECLLDVRRNARSSPPPPPSANAPAPAPAPIRDMRFGQGRSIMARKPGGEPPPLPPKPPSRPSVPRPKVPFVEAARPRPPVVDDRKTVPAPPPDVEGTAIIGIPARAVGRVIESVVIRDESTSDDATIVIPRKDFGKAIVAEETPPPASDPYDYDPENTVVDPPSFLNDSVTIDTRKPGEKP